MVACTLWDIQPKIIFTQRLLYVWFQRQDFRDFILFLVRYILENLLFMFKEDLIFLLICRKVKNVKKTKWMLLCFVKLFADTVCVHLFCKGHYESIQSSDSESFIQ